MNRRTCSFFLIGVAVALVTACATRRAPSSREDYSGPGESVTSPALTQKREPVPSAAAPSPMNYVGTGASSLDVRKVAPDAVGLGEQMFVELLLTANEDLRNVIVADEIPDGVTLLGTNPQAVMRGRELVWNIGAMSRGEQRKIIISYRAEREGVIKACASVRVEYVTCCQTRVGRPVLAIVKDGPAQALLHERCTYTVVVSNVGSAVARDVVLTDTLPPGMAHDSGSKALTQRLGDLAPGQAARVEMPVRAVQRGRWQNWAVASAANAAEVRDDAITVVATRDLAIRKTGTRETFVGKRATYEIVVVNRGDTRLTDVVVMDTVPPEMRVVSAPGGIINGNQVTWRIATLAPGAEERLQLTVLANAMGRFCNQASVTTDEGLRGASQACTVVRGLAALLIEMVDVRDPLMVGESTAMRIRITNQGSAEDRNVRLVLVFPPELTPSTPAGATTGRVEGNTVVFSPYPVLAPQQRIEYSVRITGRQAGDARTRAQMTSELIRSPVTEEESTHVY
ncbi:MAG: DUF11 domain-containing protein [bacterium]|nr:DUF11 domain-containing protein [bacterium]